MKTQRNIKKSTVPLNRECLNSRFSVFSSSPNDTVSYKGSQGKPSEPSHFRLRTKLLIELPQYHEYALAMYIKVKSWEIINKKYSVFYTINQVSEISDIHYTTAKEYLNKLIGIGLVTTVNNKYIFNKGRASNKKHDTILNIDPLDSVNSIANDLRGYRLKLKISSQEYIANLFQVAKYGFKKDGTKASLSEIRASRSTLRTKTTYDCRKNDFKNNGISLSTLAEFLHISIPTVIKTIKNAEKKGLITIQRIVEKVKYHCEEELDFLFEGNYSYTFNGYAYKVYANRYYTNNEE